MIYFLDCPTAYFDGRWRILIVYGWVKWQVSQRNIDIYWIDNDCFIVFKYSLSKFVFNKIIKLLLYSANYLH